MQRRSELPNQFGLLVVGREAKLEEYEQVPHRFDDTTASCRQNRMIHDLFEEQVQRTPHTIAVMHLQEHLTYTELNSRANQVARYLRNWGVGPDRLVSICVERSVRMVVALLGVLKAGAAYVPLDPNSPSERLQHMLDDIAPDVVLTQDRLRVILPPTKAQVIALDSEWEEIARCAAENLPASEIGVTAENLVYVIYTSGSTGKPKGTAMAHSASVNLIEWHRNHLRLPLGRRVLQFAALSFDVAFQETFSTLCTGSTLVLLDEWIRRDVRALADLLSTCSIQTLFVPPLMLQNLAELFQVKRAVRLALQDVITAGEQLRISPEITSFLQQIPGCRLHNHYGPTETHVVTALTLAGDPRAWPAVPTIGQPISNTQIHVLNGQRQPVPIGVAGEIYVGGAGVARGYLNRPELTAERFIADPFSGDPQARMYKTGDLGRWRADGTLEYLGRNDDQVKIRGFRIELGEIEAQLARHTQVKEAVVVAREDVPGEKRLVAYITCRDENNLSAEALRAHLKGILPEYMVPSAFVVVESFPLTANGKLDRRALPVPELGAYASRRYEAPQGKVEEILAKIWQELLRMERVGRQDNFFELGGHSLLLVQMMERLRRVGLSAEVRRVFESPTLADLASALASEAIGQFEVPPNLIPRECEAITPQMLPLVELDAQQIERIVQAVPGGTANIQDIYSLAPLQEGILFHHVLREHGGDAYVLPMLLSVSSREKLEELITALQAVIDRHDILRTAVLWEQLPQPVQVVYRRATLPVEEIALNGDRAPVEQLKERMRPERQRLDLRQAPLIRLLIAADTQSTQWYALLQTHHLVCDDESLHTMLSEVMVCLNGRAQELPEPVAYRNHVAQALAHVRMHDAEAFFRSKLAEIDEPTAPFGLLDVHGDGSRIEEARQPIDTDLATRIRIQARRLGVSAATLFHAAWALVVSRTSGRDDVVYGTVLLGRLQGNAGAQRTLGMFINTLPLRLRLQGVTAKELVQQTQRELAELLDHEQSSLAVAQRCSGILGAAPLFSTLLNYRHSARHVSAEEAEKASGIQMLGMRSLTNYPITLSVHDQGEGFALEVHTSRHIDSYRIASYVQRAMQSLVGALEEVSKTPVLALPVLPESERHQIVELFNATQATYPQERLIHELFEDQVERTPDAIAVIYEGQSLTYAELNKKANQLARYLRSKGVGPDKLVAICVERSLEMVVGLLGILKAGGAYVPLDPNYPAERLAYMLSDAVPKVLLLQERLKGKVPNTVSEMIGLDDDWDKIAEHIGSNLDLRTVGMRSYHLAYVIYTSGSTGQPKGAMNEHRAVINRLQWMQSEYLLSDNDRVLQKTPFSFDVSVWEFFWTLMAGARLVVARPEGHKDPAYLTQVIEQEGVTTLHFVPSMLQIFLDQHRTGRCQSLRHVVCSGEELPTSLQRKFFECLPQTRLSNLYGPTEAAIDVTAWECRPDDVSSRVSIGRPISNIQMFVLDRYRQTLPIGVTGEICIGGVGVGRGYLSRPQLTAERFVADPFSSKPHARLYRTGDLGRWRADGSIEYLGRSDHQVKIRGFRIELGEIEAQLLRLAQVKDAVVIAREEAPGDKYLVAYVIPKDPAAEKVAPSVEAMRDQLKAVLPEYMVPSAYVMLERFPLTPNGKLDRRALPMPEPTAYVFRQHEGPQGEAEEIVAEIWQEMLNVDHVGREDNFFELGGHSLLAMRMVVRAQALLSIEMPMSVLFECPTLRQFSARVDELRQARLLNSIERGENGIDELLERVAMLSDSKIQELVRELKMGGRA